MGFHVEINSILRTDDLYELVRGGVYDFRKEGSRVFFDTLPIWLVRSDWTPLAEIDVVNQIRTSAEVRGTFKVRYVYQASEQPALAEVLRRMYAAGGDPNIYILISGENHDKSVAAGEYQADSLATEGFIHASPAGQLTRVANKYYKTLADVRLLIVALEKIALPVKWELAAGSLFPHIYGPLNMDAVLKVLPIRPGANGDFLINPGDLRV